MKLKIYFLSFLLSWVFEACPSKKIETSKDDKTPVVDSSAVKILEIKAEADTSLDDVIYDAIGRSTSKNETIARDKAELLGRAELVKVLAKDAHRLIKDFSAIEKSVFSPAADGDAFGKKVEEAMIRDSKLSGSKPTEYNRSANKDTLLVTVEIPLMGGFEAMERVMIEVGQKEKYLSDVDNFRKLFKQYFVAQKKKALTEPS